MRQVSPLPVCVCVRVRVRVHSKNVHKLICDAVVCSRMWHLSATGSGSQNFILTEGAADWAIAVSKSKGDSCGFHIWLHP